MPKATDFVRSYPYPALTEGSLSFPNGEYVPRIHPAASGYAAHVEHQINNAPFIENIIQEKKAACSCIVSIPITGYRKIFANLQGEISQKIEWDPDSVGQSPILQPLVILRERLQHEFSQKDGVHEMWAGRTVVLPKGAKIAVGETWRLSSAMESLLSIEKNKNDTDCAQMRVTPCTDSGFYFKVQVKSDLYEFLQSPGGGNRRLHRRSILIHAVSCCFAILAKEYTDKDVEEDNWAAFQNLKILHAEMESKDIRTWDADDFSPEEAATAMWPHIIPGQELEDV